MTLQSRSRKLSACIAAAALALGICPIASASIVTNFATGDTNIRGPFGYWADDNNYGAATDIHATTEAYDGDDARRVLVKFDLSNVEATVSSASLGLHVFGWYDGEVQPHSLTIYRGTKDWVENQVTWNHAATGDAWDTPGGGGDFDDSVSVTSDTWSESGSRSIDVTALVQDAVDAGQTYMSFHIFGNAAGRVRIDVNRVEGTGSKWPTLTVDSVPEPASIALLGAGAGLMLVRHRRSA